MTSMAVRLYQLAEDAGLATDFSKFHAITIADATNGQRVPIRMGTLICHWCGRAQSDVYVLGTATDAYRTDQGHRQRYFSDIQPSLNHLPCNQEDETTGLWLTLHEVLD